MRLRGYADEVPKPMVQIGTRPILWHLMKYYAHFGHKDFVLCLGYRGSIIKDYFLHYEEATSNDFIWSQGGKRIEFVNRDMDEWTITFVETGADATIGERLKAVAPHLQGEDIFLANYADGLSDLELPRMIDMFRQSDAVGAMLLVQPTASFDIVRLTSDGMVSGISALARSDIWINGGFFVFRKEILNYIHPGEELVREPFQRLIEKRAMLAFKCPGFWQCMDTFKDKQRLEDLNEGDAPWKIWNHIAGVDGSVPGKISTGGSLNLETLNLETRSRRSRHERSGPVLERA
jgi:glucose-1-phosphate cytidylyltransferase